MTQKHLQYRMWNDVDHVPLFGAAVCIDLPCFVEQALTHVLKLGLLVVGATTLTDILPPLRRLRGLWVASVINIIRHLLTSIGCFL